MSYITTGLGFVQGIEYNQMEQNPRGECVILYTPHLRYAKYFTKKAGLNFIKNKNLIGFIYNPIAEEPLRDLYEIRKKQNLHSCVANEYKQIDLIDEYIVQRAVMKSETDIKFFQSGKLVKDSLYTFEDAKAKAIEMNEAILNQLQEKINLKKENLY